MAKVLIVDDEPAILTLLTYQVGKLGYEIAGAASGEEALESFRAERPDAVLLDINLPGIDGLEVLTRMRAVDSGVPVLMMTAVYIGGRGVADGINSVQVAVKALSLGAYDYLLKPSDEFMDKVRLALQNAVREREERLHGARGSSPASAASAGLEPRAPISEARFTTIIGDSPEMRAVFRMTEKVLSSSATVLILGESGTGKELLARAIHYNSPRRDHELVVLNCAAITETLLESELFGHEKGSFTGAATRKIGKFEAADGGTIFLDEIGDMPLTTQAKVLRVLQEGEVMRVGGTERIHVDVRCIAATHRDLDVMVEAGEFREDLYYRLNVYPITIPPLRARRADIPLLAAHFVRRHAQAHGKPITGIADNALDALDSHDWPGNVRELENALLRAVILAETDEIRAEDLPPAVALPRRAAKPSPTLAEIEAGAVREALLSAGYDPGAAAARLGITVGELRARAARQGIELAP